MPFISQYRILTGVIATLFLLVGCADRDYGGGHDILVRVNGFTVTVEEFSDALEITKAAYPFNILLDEAIVKGIKTRLLKQMTEELMLAKRAEELGIVISDVELDEAVASIREDYPESSFEAALLENAIPLPAWKSRLRKRLLMEKLIEKELVEQVSITPEEISRYYERISSDPEGRYSRPENIDGAMIRQLRRKKAQAEYPEWIEGIQQRYQMELNEEKWKEILG